MPSTLLLPLSKVLAFDKSMFLDDTMVKSNKRVVQAVSRTTNEIIKNFDIVFMSFALIVRINSYGSTNININ